MTIKPVFKAADDSEHATAAAAERQNKVVKAKQAFKEAAGNVCRALKESALTADGEVFTDCRTDFWWITNNYGGGLPRLVKLYVWP